MGANSLPKTVTRQRRGCDLNPGPSAPESEEQTRKPYKSRRTDRCAVWLWTQEPRDRWVPSFSDKNEPF